MADKTSLNVEEISKWERKAANLMTRGGKKGSKKALKRFTKEVLELIDLGWQMATKKERRKLLKAIKMDKKEFKRFRKGKRKHLPFEKMVIIFSMLDIELSPADVSEPESGEE